VQATATYSGYSLQYLRRLLRNGKLEGIKIGQTWLVGKGALDAHLNQAKNAGNHRYGPRFFKGQSLPSDNN